jgi:MFS family permease
MLGISLGPALGPVIGGLLAGYGGWRSIFWFLLALGGVTLILMLTLVPETCRAVFGNASVRPQWWNLNLVQWLATKKPGEKRQVKEERHTIAKPRKSTNPLSALKILLEPEGGITLGFGALLFAGYFVSIFDYIPVIFLVFSAALYLNFFPIPFRVLHGNPWPEGMMCLLAATTPRWS